MSETVPCIDRLWKAALPAGKTQLVGQQAGQTR